MSLPRPGPLLLIRDAVPADRPPFAIRHPPSVICHLSFAICSSAICHLPFRAFVPGPRFRAHQAPRFHCAFG